MLGQDFEGHLAAQLGVLGFVHLTHAARTELAGNPIVRNRRANHACFVPGRFYCTTGARRIAASVRPEIL